MLLTIISQRINLHFSFPDILFVFPTFQPAGFSSFQNAIKITLHPTLSHSRPLSPPLSLHIYLYIPILLTPSSTCNKTTSFNFYITTLQKTPSKQNSVCSDGLHISKSIFK
ncbi:hypothetical protein LDENG_00019810 [Lucifuga dentata]|nr:hypothetical protein LDENG_00019810 [Lucifuga dentata]